jgi:hypothetical protein
MTLFRNRPGARSSYRWRKEEGENRLGFGRRLRVQASPARRPTMLAGRVGPSHQIRWKRGSVRVACRQEHLEAPVPGTSSPRRGPPSDPCAGGRAAGVPTASGDRKISEISQVLTGQQVRRERAGSCGATTLSLIRTAGNEVPWATLKISEISQVCVGGDLRACPGAGRVRGGCRGGGRRGGQDWAGLRRSSGAGGAGVRARGFPISLPFVDLDQRWRA